MDFLNNIEDYATRLKNTIDVVQKKDINHFANILLDFYEREKQIFIFGNGGSGATASHVACDFNKGVCLSLNKKFKFICLNDNIPSILAYSNDVSYDDVFVSQLKNYLSSGDLVVGISGSGKSINVVKALQCAQDNGAQIFSLCGYDGGTLKAMSGTNCIHVPIHDMQIVEDCHVIIFHMIMQILYRTLNK